MEVYKEFTFDSAHSLPNVPDGHKCKALHGHTYKIRLSIHGRVDPATGFVLDFEEIAQAWRVLHKKIDHKHLNNVPGLNNPTTEVLAAWVWRNMMQLFATQHGADYMLERQLVVAIREAATCGCVYRGPENEPA